MKEYLLLTLEEDELHASRSPAAMWALIEKSEAYAEALQRDGRLKDRGRFRPSKEGKRVRQEGERLVVDDGPFTPAGRRLTGYYWIEADSLAEASRLAMQCPLPEGSAVDVRPLMKGKVPSDKAALPGKLFACAVLGSGETEDGWVAAMDRIDAETRGRFPEASFLGGLRLEPPSRGRRTVVRGERHAMVDGPFLESKEVVGGLLVLRMTSIDDAVRWARRTAFVAHGALEIRELWRT